MPTATLTSKCQITVPRPIREAFDLQPGDRLSFRAVPGGFLLEKEDLDVRRLRGVFKSKRRVSLAEMEAAIRRGASGR